MPSTFTERLRLVLQATGENDGTWGTLTNNSALKLIDAAIAGVQTKDISGSGDVSLTVNNGATDESRKAVLKLTGILTGDRNVVVPSVEKVYVVDPSGVTFGGHTLTIKTSGGTGVVLTTNSLIFCDGTDVIKAVTTFDSSVLGDLAFLDTVDTAQIEDGAVTGDKLDATSVLNTLGNLLFPVGSTYFTAVNTNPGTLLGFGTWSQTAQGRFIVGVGEGTDANSDTRTYAQGNDSVGEYEHTLTEAEMPSHTHTGDVASITSTPTPNANPNYGSFAAYVTSGTINSTGGDVAHENSPPAFGLYVWERTA